MTLVAIATTAEAADVVTDTHLGGQRGRWAGRASKVQMLPQYDAVLVVQGDHYLALSLSYSLILEQANDFDGLIESIAAHARWAEAQPHVSTETRSPDWDSQVLVVGYSPKAQAFKAYRLAQADGFEPVDLRTDEQVFIFPAPHTPPVVQQLTGEDSEWIDLVTQAHYERSMDLFGLGRKVPFGGQIIRTTLVPGLIHSRVMHTIPLLGAAFHEQQAGCLHPSSQLGPCPSCRSGRPYVECCLDDPVDGPCSCGSARTFADCCRVDPATDLDGPCPCGRTSTLRDCCAPIPGGWAGQVLDQAPELVALFDRWADTVLDELLQHDATDVALMEAFATWTEGELQEPLVAAAARGVDTAIYMVCISRRAEDRIAHGRSGLLQT